LVVEKPDFDAVTLYVPGGTAVKTYLPDALVVALNFTPDEESLRVTVAPGISAPLGSEISPTTVPVFVAWPAAEREVANTHSTAATIIRIHCNLKSLITAPPLELLLCIHSPPPGTKHKSNARINGKTAPHGAVLHLSVENQSSYRIARKAWGTGKNCRTKLGKLMAGYLQFGVHL
jgi:hypothetical protein